MTGPTGDVGASLPLRIGATLIVFGGTALAFLGGGAAKAHAGLLPPPLELGQPTCSVSAQRAAAWWRTAERAGLSRMARYPFDAADGVAAVSLLHDAVLCARDAFDPAAALRLEMVERQWNARIRTDYRSRIVRVRVALDREPRAVALHEVTELSRMLDQSPGEYSKWLEATKRRLDRGGERQ